MKHVLTAFAIFFPAAASMAQTNRLDQLDIRNDSRELRQDLRQGETASATARTLLPAAESSVSTLLSVGVAHTSGDDQHAWDTPVLAVFTFSQTLWRLSISTLGYEHDTFPEGRAHGWTDVKLKATYPLQLLVGTLTAGIATRAPSHGEVGSTDRQDELSLAYNYSKEQWHVTLAGALKHNLGDIPPGVSHYPRYGAVSVGRDLTDMTSWSLIVDRLVIPGRAGISTAGVAYDFAFLPTKIRAWNAELSVSKGLSDADRSASIEFDLSHRF